MTSGIDCANEDGILVATFARPEVMNAWDRAMRREITGLLRHATDDPAVEAIVFTGAGERAFGAGQDLREPPPLTGEDIDLWVDEWQDFFGAIRHSPKPVVCALNGVTVGSTLHFALLADLRIAHEGVRLGQPEVKSGVASSMGPWVLAHALGPLRATDLVLTGRLLGAPEAHALGLVTRIVGRDEVREVAIAAARDLAARPKRAFALTKARLLALSEPSFVEAFAIWKDLLRQTRDAAT